MTPKLWTVVRTVTFKTVSKRRPPVREKTYYYVAALTSDDAIALVRADLPPTLVTIESTEWSASEVEGGYAYRS